MAIPDLTLIIPAFNEGTRLQAGFARLERAHEEGRIDLETIDVLYVDDGSDDDTGTRAAHLVATLPHGRVLTQLTNLGKGAAVRTGVAAATTATVAFCDADLAIDPRQLPSLVSALALAPIAVGSRAVRGHIDYGSRLRTVAGRGFNLLVRRLSSVELKDTQCGFKGLRTGEAKLLFHLMSINGFAFDVELLARARLFDWNVEEVPVSWSDVGGSHVRLARDSVAMLIDLIGARRAARRFPTITGLENLGATSAHDIAAAVADTVLEAAPLVELADGRRVLLSPLVAPNVALGALRDASRTIGGTAVELPARELINCSSVTTLTRPI